MITNSYLSSSFSRITDTITKMSSTWCVLDNYSLVHQNARHEFTL